MDNYRRHPSIYRFDNVDGNDVGLAGSVMAAYRASPKLSLVFGMIGSPDSDAPVLPILGAHWRLNRRTWWNSACQTRRLSAEQMLDTGLVDYALGAAPHTGAFVVVYEDKPLKQVQLGYVKMGDGPFYVFYTPFHLPHIQIASTIGRAVLYGDPTVAPIAGPVCEVIALAKRDMRAGERLDGVGGFCAYGLIDNTEKARAIDALPLSLSENCVLRRDVAKDQVISFADVEQPDRGVVDQLWNDQLTRWSDAKVAVAK